MKACQWESVLGTIIRKTAFSSLIIENTSRLLENGYMAYESGVFTAHGSNILALRKGGGRIALLGLPFFLVGLFVAQIPFGIIPVQVEGGPIILAILLPLGPLFAAVGFMLVLSRSGSIIDRNNLVVVQWWGLLIPMKKKVYNLDSFAKVRIEYRPGSRNSPESFAISLTGGALQHQLLLADLADHDLAVKAANELAYFIGKPLEDLAHEVKPSEP